MATPGILHDIQNLPPEAPKQVEDFVVLLKVRYGVAPHKKAKRGKWEDEPFFCKWKDRDDKRDSVKWARDLRRNQWNRRA